MQVEIWLNAFCSLPGIQTATREENEEITKLCYVFGGNVHFI